MRDFRRLPPLLRVTSILGLLFALAAVALLGWGLITGLSPRMFALDLNLGIFGGACTYVTVAYNTQLRRPGRRTPVLDSWQSQVRVIALMAALPLCALVLASLISPNQLAFATVPALSMLAALVLAGAYARALIQQHAAQ